jgi:pteridine reductase
MNLTGRVALVTGAGRRLGRAIGERLAAEGMRIAIHYHSSAAEAEEARNGIVAAGGEAHLFQADLAAPDAPEQLVRDVMDHFGGMAVLVNSAAIMIRTPLGTVTADDWDRVFSLNLRAPFLLAQAAAPHLRAAAGAIVNIADLAAYEAWPGYLPHGASKAGVVYLTRSLATVLAPDIRVNAIAPGVVLLPDDWPDSAAERLRATTPLEKLGDPGDVCDALVFLLRSDFITGETLIVDGGRHVRR